MGKREPALRIRGMERTLRRNSLSIAEGCKQKVHLGLSLAEF